MGEGLRRTGRKFYPAYLWLVTRALNEQTEFKVAEKDGQVLLPLCVTCHHAATDGRHMSRFLEKLQSDMDRFAEITE